MFKEQYQNETVCHEEEKGQQQILKFIDGQGFDRLLQFLIKGLFFGMIGFCVPYFCFILFTLLF